MTYPKESVSSFEAWHFACEKAEKGMGPSIAKQRLHIEMKAKVEIEYTCSPSAG
jgi:hypothetical protein